MFQNLKQRLGTIFSNLKGRGFLKESDIDEALRDVRRALIEADVALDVIRLFIAQVREEAFGREILKSLSPEHIIIKLVHDKLVTLLTPHELLVSEPTLLHLATKKPAVVLMCGLQGSGKTTSSAKLAYFLHNTHKKKVLLASVDVYRPAAREQLQTLAHQHGLEMLPFTPQDKNPLLMAKNALSMATAQAADVLIVDTAGRLQVDAALMAELLELKRLLNPADILFVADSMMGQESLAVAKTFHEALDLTGHILTRLDGDARGGVALSIGVVTQKPLKFLGTGEKVRDFEIFDPERIAGRILDQGDVVSLVKQVEHEIGEEDLKQTTLRLQKGLFNLNDMEKQLTQMNRLGSFDKVLNLLPGMGQIKDHLAQIKNEDAQKVLQLKLAIIRSMTPRERRYPKILGASRKRRIARGSGTDVSSVNRLLKEFEQMGKMMKRMGRFSKGAKNRGGFSFPKGPKPF